MKKRSEKRKEERFIMHASLCGGSDLLKAQGLVAHYLPGSIFYSTNDTKELTFKNFYAALAFAFESFQRRLGSVLKQEEGFLACTSPNTSLICMDLEDQCTSC